MSADPVDQVPTQWVLMYGNVSDGYQFIGPFESASVAETFADSYRHLRNQNHFVVAMTTPVEYLKESLQEEPR